MNSGNSDNLTLNAGKAVEVNTDWGSIAMLNGSNALGGSMILNAPNVSIASRSILSQLSKQSQLRRPRHGARFQ